jgi:hypothetical protein
MPHMSDTANPSTTPAPAKPAELPSPLSLGWRAWCKLVQELGKGPDDLPTTSACATIQKRLHRFAQGHTGEPAAVKRVLSALYRAVPLLQAALTWEEPSVGGKAEKRSATDKRRGEQWRLVLSFSGFETLTKALLAIKGRGGIKPEHIEIVLNLVKIPDHIPVEVPAHKPTDLDDWFSADAQEELLDFLCLDHGDAKITASWLVERKPMVTWLESLSLAKALRNATVHGALSASKITEWKLATAIARMVDDIAIAAGAVLTRLAEVEL